jgi:2-polyprenyl-3-methyl-5-hydroxy-6-metoxy-1,4-benzoquinol methylase
VDAAPAPKCPACAADRPRTIGALPAVNVFAGQVAATTLPASSLFGCFACGLLFRHPVLSRSQYDALYGEVPPTAWPDRSGRTDWALIVDYIGRTSAAGASILDFGCHTGGLLRRLGSRYALHGAEVNRAAAKVARERSGAEVFGGLDALPRGKQFDFVTAVDVVEHFPDPGLVIASLLEATKPGGALILTTGDADHALFRLAGARWWYCFYPEHLAFISARWVRDWLQRNGRPARLAEARKFRYERLAPLRYLRQAFLTCCYLAAPRAYTVALRRLKRFLGRPGDVDPPGIGLTEDHIFLVLRKTA